MRTKLLTGILVTPLALAMHSCSTSAGSSHGNLVEYSTVGKIMATHPTVAQRESDISSEQTGSHYIGRRYSVNNTTFWGYLRKPKKSWDTSRMVVMNEDSKLVPDRLPESGATQNYRFDQNYEYKIWGNYTGETIYEPNSNLFLPEFKLKSYELINKDPGWIFSPADRYDPEAITLRRN